MLFEFFNDGPPLIRLLMQYDWNEPQIFQESRHRVLGAVISAMNYKYLVRSLPIARNFVANGFHIIIGPILPDLLDHGFEQRSRRIQSMNISIVEIRTATGKKHNW